MCASCGLKSKCFFGLWELHGFLGVPNKPYSTYKFLRRQLIYPGARDSLSVRYSSPMRNICCWSPQNSSEADMQILVRGPLLGSEKQSGMWQLTRGTNTRKTTFAVVSRPLHEGRKFR